MHWLTDFNQARSYGQNTFLFTGNVGDAFPELDKIPHEQPVDQLNPLFTVCAHHLTNGNIVIVFDPALGFAFPRTEDEQAVHRIINNKRPARETHGMSAIERASARIQEKARLPRDPTAAFDVMFEVLETTAQQPKPQPCIIIIPDVDAIAPRTQNAQTMIALCILRFAHNYRFQAAGHLLLMTAPTASSVDARLTAMQTPVRLITINRPTEEERKRYLATVCADVNECTARLAEKESALQNAIEQERVRIEFLLSDLREKLEQHMNARHSTLMNDNAYQRANTLRERAIERLDEYRKKWNARKAKRIKKMEEDIMQLARRRDSDECNDMPLTDALWRKLKVDDCIRWTFVLVKNGKPETHTSSYRVVKKLSKGGVELSQPLPEGYAHLFNDGTNTICFYMENGMIYGETPKGTIQFPGVKPKFELISTRRKELGKTIIELMRKRRMFMDLEDVPDEVTQQDKLVARIQTACEEAEQKALEHWEEAKRNLERTIQSLHESYEHPTTVDIERARQEYETVRGHMAMFKEDDMMPFALNGAEIESAARLLQGYGYRDMLSMLKHAEANNERLNERHMREQRIATLRRSFGDLLEIVEPAYGWDGIAGLENIRDELNYIRDRMLEGDYKRVPQGIILMGPPGTGKTAIAQAWARECDMLFVKVKNLKEPWVGSSEQRTDMAIQALLDLAPCIVLKDEADQLDQGRDSFQGDSGVSNYIRRAWMEFESRPDIRGRVVIIKCTNRPDLIDVALMRDQRTDERIPVLMPDAHTRFELFLVTARREGFDLRIEHMQQFVDATDGLSGANIQKIIRHADRWAGKSGTSYIDDEALKRALEDFQPENNQRDIARMSLLAINACSSRQYLPKNMDELVERYTNMLNADNEPQQKASPLPDIIERILNRNPK